MNCPEANLSAQVQWFRAGIVEEIPALRNFATTISGSRQSADDLVQETLLKAWRNVDRFRAGSNLRAWLFVILRNTYFTDRRRRRHEVPAIVDFIEQSIVAPGNQEATVDLENCRVALEQLSPTQRDVLIMVGVLGYSVKEAAEACRTPVGTVKSRLSRARAHLEIAMSHPKSRTFKAELS